MEYKYFHDERNRTVYRILAKPDCIPSMSGRGKNAKQIAWRVSTTIDITRADNELIAHRWRYRTSDLRHHHFESDRHTQDEAMDYFIRNNTPDGVPIDADTYERLHEQYGGQSHQRTS